MKKSSYNVRDRLQSAALELFREQGYEKTTAAEIAAKAGVTERTFFRQFPDKKEVLFDREAMVMGLLTASIDEAPAELDPLDVLLWAFRSFQPVLEDGWDYAKPRHDLIVVTPALHEREVAKLAALADALGKALIARGIPDLRASLAAHIGMAAFSHAASAWMNDPTISLGDRIDAAFREVRSVLTGNKETHSATRATGKLDFGSKRTFGAS